MLIITGPEESGMRELALFCRKLGFETGGDAQETVGEADAVVRIHREICRQIEGREEGEGPSSAVFGKLGSLFRPIFRKDGGAVDLDRLRKEYEEAIRSISSEVILDSRFMRCSALLEIWHAVHSDLRVLLTHRAPEPFSDTQGRSSGTSSSADGLRERFSDCIEALLKQDIDFRILLYPQLLRQYETVYAAFSDLGFHFDLAEGERIWKDLAESGVAAIGSTSVNENETRR